MRILDFDKERGLFVWVENGKIMTPDGYTDNSMQHARRKWAVGPETPAGHSVTELAKIMAKLLS